MVPGLLGLLVTSVLVYTLEWTVSEKKDFVSTKNEQYENVE